MCVDIQKATFTCGHQGTYFWGKSRFCLFTGEGKARFHNAYLVYDRIDESCPRCKITAKLKASGQALKGAAFRQAVDDAYKKSKDAADEAAGKRFEAQSQVALSVADFDELNQQVKERIAFYLAKPGVSRTIKVALLRTLARLPDRFDRQGLVAFFGSRYFAPSDKDRVLHSWERKELTEITRKVGLERTFKGGLAMEVPLPLPGRVVVIECWQSPEPSSEASTGAMDEGEPAAAQW